MSRNRRPRDPSHLAIARHWVGDWPDHDLDDPRCMACSGTVYTSSAGRGKSSEGLPLGKRWARLERAHIVAHQFGGANEPSNYLLLCPPCHNEAPDVPFPQFMIEWALQRDGEATRYLSFAQEVVALVMSMGFDEIDMEPWGDPDNREQLMDMVYEMSGLHRGMNKAATFAAAAGLAGRRFNAEAAMAPFTEGVAA